MCTVSWLDTPDGYDLFCNRDEKLSRPRAESPCVRTWRGVTRICPQDPAGGGTWIGVNEFGVSACLLNLYVDAPPGKVSRGLLVRDALSYRTSFDAAQALVRRCLKSFAPFTMLLLDSAGPPLIVSWDSGRKVLLLDARRWKLLTSSSVAQGAAWEHRRAAFPRVRTVSALRAFHASHEPQPGPCSACMHREDAETVSFSHIHVERDRVRFEYVDGPPCLAEFTLTTSLDRTNAYPSRNLYAAG